MTKKTLRLSAALSAAALTYAACGPAGPAALTVTADPRTIDNQGQVSTITIDAVDANGKPGTGNVRISSTAGSLVDRIEVPLASGSATVEFSCDVAQDPGCARSVRVLGEWVADGVRVEGLAIVTVRTVAAASDGGTDGGADAGSTDAGTDAGSVDAGNNDAGIGDALCTSEIARLAGGASTLARFFPYGTTDMVGLCNGRVLLGATSSGGALVTFDAVAGQTERTYALQAPPGDIDLDYRGQVAFAAHPGSADISLVNLDSGVTTVLSGPSPWDRVGALAFGGDVLFAAYANSNGPGQFAVLAFRLDGGTPDVIPTTGRVDLLDFSTQSQTLLAADIGISPATVKRIAQDAGAWVEVQSSTAFGSNGRDLVVSTDGTSFAFAAGSGNGPPYVIRTASVSDLTQSLTAYDAGPYPESADFSPDGGRFVCTNRSQLLVFDSSSSALVRAQSPQPFLVDAGITCSMGSFTRTRYSPFGTFAYGLYACADGGVIVTDSAP